MNPIVFKIDLQDLQVLSARLKLYLEVGWGFHLRNNWIYIYAEDGAMKSLNKWECEVKIIKIPESQVDYQKIITNFDNSDFFFLDASDEVAIFIKQFFSQKSLYQRLLELNENILKTCKEVSHERA